MSSSLVSVLHHEERSIVAELRASKPFQRLEAIRRLLALYDVQPSVATGLDIPVSSEPDRAGGEVIHFATAPAPAAAPPPVAAQAYTAPPIAAPASAAAQSAPVASAIPLPGPAAVAPAAATQVAAIAEAAMADVVMRSPAPAVSAAQGVEPETSSVVSSVRAALLGIGKA